MKLGFALAHMTTCTARCCKKIDAYAVQGCEYAGMNWDDLKVVLALARAGTLAGAAAQTQWIVRFGFVQPSWFADQTLTFA